MMRQHIDFIVVTLLVSLIVSALLITSCDTSSVNRVQGVRAMVVSNGNVIVYWEGVTIKRDLIGYNVYWSRDPEFPQDSHKISSASKTADSHTICELETGEWYIRVRALFLCTYGFESSQKKVEGPWSETTTVTIPSTISQQKHEFNKWGISFTTPAQWQRWSSDKESAFAAKVLQSVDDLTLKVQFVYLAGWSTADEAAAMILTVQRERSGVTLQLSDILARKERDNKRAKEYGDATEINRLELCKIGGHPCVVHDVTLRAAGRMLTYDFVSGPQQVQVQWVFRDAARFEELKPAVDGVLKTFSLGGN